MWARIVRKDGKKCRSGGQNYARILVQQARSDGTRAETTLRIQPVGTTRTAPLQLDRVSGATDTGKAGTVRGATIGNSAAINL